MATQIAEIHTSLFGVAGHGGLHKRVDAMEKDVDKLKGWQGRVVGMTAVVTGAISIAAGKLLDHWSK